MRRLIQLLIPGVLLSGCFGPGEGVEVPKDEIYFPVGLALSRDVDPAKQSLPADFLFVVSSDFDLQYNGGAVQSYDLNVLVDKLPRRCVVDADCVGAETGAVCQAGGMCAASQDENDSPCPQGDRADSDRLLFPGRCNPIDPKGLQRSSVKIGAFATDALLRERPKDKTAAGDAPERLFVPVRGDSTLHWLDVDADGNLECGQEGSSDHACNDQHRAGDQPTENTRGITLNAEPFALDADVRGDNIVVTNQTSGTASLFTNDAWAVQGPKLAFALSSDRIPSRPVGIAAVPQPPAADADDPAAASRNDTFMMTFRDSAQVRLFRFAADLPEVMAAEGMSGNQPRPYLVDGGGVGIQANSVGSDSRGIAIDDSARKAARTRCAAGDKDCAAAAELVPLDVYVANRAPSSLLIGRTTPPQEYPYFFQTVPLTTGPSRVIVGQVKKPGSDETETRVFVACFESRRVFVYDPQRARVETEILTGRGPHALAVDTARGLLYVGHFTDSYVGVYSLDLASPATYGTMLGTLGTPKSPRASK
jgi:hypothetical protein